jgi:outer membrane usher protein FimD/PapC
MRDCLGRLLPASALLLVLFASPVFSQGALKPISINPDLALVEREVQLEVFINNETTGLIVAFKFSPAGNVLRAQRGELKQAGVKVPGSGSDSELVRIDTLGLSFNFDEARQRILFTLRDDERLAREYNARGSRKHVEPTANPGLVVNYSVFAGSFKDSFSSGLTFSGANVSLDARAFSRFGVFKQTGIIGTTLYNNDRNYLRLETTYSYFHPDLMLTAEAGDIVSGGLKWSRPIRMGGIQYAAISACAPVMSPSRYLSFRVLPLYPPRSMSMSTACVRSRERSGPGLFRFPISKVLRPTAMRASSCAMLRDG